jgi:nucleoside-diphosphate-sugar epimerase
LSIGELATVVAAQIGGVEVRIASPAPPGVAPARYVPSVDRAERELGLRCTVPLADGIRRTARWHSGSLVDATRQRTSK